MMRLAMFSKAAGLLLVLPLGVLWLQGYAVPDTGAFAGLSSLPPGLQTMGQASTAAAAGALLINLLFTVSVGITGGTVLWVVRRRARAAHQATPAQP
jgi:hypothetical protein